MCSVTLVNQSGGWAGLWLVWRVGCSPVVKLFLCPIVFHPPVCSLIMHLRVPGSNRKKQFPYGSAGEADVPLAKTSLVAKPAYVCEVTVQEFGFREM